MNSKQTRRLYWNYVQRHPSHIPTPIDAEREVTDALTWYLVGKPSNPV